MKLSKLYSNLSLEFSPIHFRSGLNVVLAEIRLPENQNKDTHNLGKTTLGRLIDFCLLSKKDNDLFLFRNQETFKDFEFYLEIELFNGRYLTIQRGVESASKISLMTHDAPNQDFSGHPEDSWTHWKLAFNKAKGIVDGILDLRAIEPWGFRKGISQFFRLQSDFQVFNKNSIRGKDKDWKPFVAKILGVDFDSVNKHYEIKERIEAKKSEQKKSATTNDIGKTLGAIALIKADRDGIQDQLNQFDFHQEDRRRIEEAVHVVGSQVDSLNSQLYYLESSLKKITSSLKEEKSMLNPDQIERLFRETVGFFPEQIKVDFQNLLKFNQAITTERNGYLREEKEKVSKEITQKHKELTQLSQKQRQLLAFLKDSDILKKYKELSNRLRDAEIELARLEDQHHKIVQHRHLLEEIKSMEKGRDKIASQIKDNISSIQEAPDSSFAKIRSLFSSIIRKALDRQALLSLSTNKDDNIEFSANYYDGEVKTNEDSGNTYNKWLCIAFDLAVIASYSQERFPSIVFHDGTFESQDIRKRELLRGIYREYASKGIQIIVTTISSDLLTPETSNYPDKTFFEDDEIVLSLHDDGQDGLLFKMPTW